MQGDPHGAPALQACVSIKSETTTGDMTLEQPLSQLRALFWTPFPQVTLQVDQSDQSVNTGPEYITCKIVVSIFWFQLERWAYVERYSLSLEIGFGWLQEFKYPRLWNISMRSNLHTQMCYSKYNQLLALRKRQQLVPNEVHNLLFVLDHSSMIDRR